MNAHAPVPAPSPIRTTCPYCGVGCGVLATPDGKDGLAVAGDPDHPANFGRLCSKGSALGETVSLEGRLLHPMLRTRSGSYERVSWNSALDATSEGFARILGERGPDAIAFYLSGQLLTEDYYIANKLMKGFLGSSHVDTNSRLCMASSVAGHRRAFGGDLVPGSYEDLDLADCIVLVGSNAAWCHPILFQRMLRNKSERGAKLIVIDPRRTAAAEEADLFLPIAPGMDSVLFAGLLTRIAESDALALDFVVRHTSGFSEALARAQAIAPDIATVALKTGLGENDIAAFYDLWLRTEKTVTAWSQGVNQSAQGTDKVNAIINCHLAAGRIGRPGLGPFSLTGQPNAMGGREAGGLANMLAAHMMFTPSDIDRVRRFWNAPVMAKKEGLKAVAMMDAIAEGRISALWVMATNPAASLPRAGHVRDALAKLDHFIVSEVVLSNDTIASGAKILLPAAAWGEKDGTVTNSERRISRQRAALPLPGEARPDWWIIQEVAKRLGFADAFDYPNAAAIFREHAALSSFENDGARGFDIGGLAELSGSDFDRLPPTQWPMRKGAVRGDERLFANGDFVTPDRKARFVGVAPPALALTPNDEFPLWLNTGRVRDHWHTMTRTGRAPRLALHRGEPFLAIHPDDAAQYGLVDGELARATSAYGSAALRVMCDDGQRRGEVFAPIHWTEETSSNGAVGALVQPTTDPFSGQPELKATPARVAPVAVDLYGFLLAREPVDLPRDIWWSRLALDGGCGYLIAGPADLFETLRARLPAGESADYVDGRRGVARVAIFSGDRLDAALFVGRSQQDGAWSAARALFARDAIDEAQRRNLLSGFAVDGAASDGPTICACFGVGLVAIQSAIAAGKADVAAIGAHLKAGTNCGSCVPELKKIIAATASAPKPAHAA
ncbi:molybdopterin-dependent oxidoreductase [Terrarubrum flagellatum]|uniref:molybdopterin-dependent oxidoreductase n=1 Tax=Terrirubrum flagellatum TaxID=2895980 RepID=UPI0031454048